MAHISSRLQKTNALRVLDARGIGYQAVPYDPAVVDALGVARLLGLPASRVLKTLVAVSSSKATLLVMVPGNRDVDLRRLALEIGHKSVRMATKNGAEFLTQLQTGGIGAIALLDRGFEVFISRDATSHQTVVVNAGRRGLGVQISPDDLIAVCGARILDI